jgi:hypothetical protein
VGGQDADAVVPPGLRPGPEAVTKVRVDSLVGVLAVIPYLLGFHPAHSLVVAGISGPHDQIKVTFRYDLPDPPEASMASAIAAHAAHVLTSQQIGGAIVVGYGRGELVTPVIDEVRTALREAGIRQRDLIRVQDGRYWSYLCPDPACCPAEGTPFDPRAHPAAATLTTAGVGVCPDRASLAASLGPVRGSAATSMLRATERALDRAGRLRDAGGGRFVAEGRQAVQDAISRYRAGGRVSKDDQIAWLAIALADLRVRDDAWARMDPEFRQAHQRLWTDIMRRACQPYVPAPASLLAFTAWQSGDGAVANLAIERALSADPAYSMACLLGEALESGLPPSAARLPMTPEEVAASYQDPDT